MNSLHTVRAYTEAAVRELGGLGALASRVAMRRLARARVERLNRIGRLLRAVSP